jgi:hypothetical protein
MFVQLSPPSKVRITMLLFPTTKPVSGEGKLTAC